MTYKQSGRVVRPGILQDGYTPGQADIIERSAGRWKDPLEPAIESGRRIVVDAAWLIVAAGAVLVVVDVVAAWP